MPSNSEFWTPERCELTKQRRADGVPASRIAAELGTTRGAVTGKALREGWPSPNKPNRTDVAYKTKKKRAPKPASIPEPIYIPPPEAASVSFRCDGGITIMELNNETCR